MKNYLVLILLCFSYEALSFELSSAHYKLLKGDESVCSTGPAKIIKDGDEETFMLGSVISIPLIKEKTRDTIADGNCTQVDELENSKTKLLFTSTISSCSKEFKHLENKVIQTVELRGSEIFYKLVDGKSTIQCHFKKENP